MTTQSQTQVKPEAKPKAKPAPKTAPKTAPKPKKTAPKTAPKTAATVPVRKKLTSITVDPNLNPREDIDMAVASEYAINVDDLPPMTVAKIKGQSGYHLIMGFTRFEAHQIAKKATGLFFIKTFTTWEDAKHEADLDNLRHGQRLTRKELQAVIQRSIIRYTHWADNRIGKLLQVDGHTIATHRAKLEATNAIEVLNVLEGADGKMHPRVKPNAKPKAEAKPEAKPEKVSGVVGEITDFETSDAGTASAKFDIVDNDPEKPDWLQTDNDEADQPKPKGKNDSTTWSFTLTVTTFENSDAAPVVVVAKRNDVVVGSNRVTATSIFDIATQLDDQLVKHMNGQFEKDQDPQ